ncbi:MAG TPA: CopG family transcriptional regulator [Gemmatimonadaceae bacterium]
MKRTTIFLPDNTLRQLQRTAQRKHVSTATLVREAVTRYLDAPETIAGLPSVSGQFSSGSSDTAERTDQLLWDDPHA